MKKTGLILTGLIIAILTHAQTIKIQGGPSFSKLNWGSPSLYDKTLTGYSVFAGIDYLNSKYFNLSSNIGMIRKGGKSEINISVPLLPATIIEKPTLDYISINTTIDLKYPIKKMSPFISCGPRFDHLIKSSSQFGGLKALNVLENKSIGLLLGGGVKFDFSKIQLGLRADYYLNFTKIAERTDSFGNSQKVTVNTYTIDLMIGYRI